MWYMISLPATNIVSWVELWEFSQRDTIDIVIISQIIAMDMICYVAYYSAANFKLPI